MIQIWMVQCIFYEYILVDGGNGTLMNTDISISILILISIIIILFVIIYLLKKINHK